MTAWPEEEAPLLQTYPTKNTGQCCCNKAAQGELQPESTRSSSAQLVTGDINSNYMKYSFGLWALLLSECIRKFISFRTLQAFPGHPSFSFCHSTTIYRKKQDAKTTVTPSRGTLRLLVSLPCLALYPSLRALSGLVGRGARCKADSWRYCQQRTRRRKRITSDCFFLHSSWMYL